MRLRIPVALVEPMHRTSDALLIYREQIWLCLRQSSLEAEGWEICRNDAQKLVRVDWTDKSSR